MLKHRKFEPIHALNINFSSNSSLQLSAIPHAMSESNLHEIETPFVEENRQGVLKLKQELKYHFHNRNLSNPSNYCSPNILKQQNNNSKAKASSRLVLNNKVIMSRNDTELESQKTTHSKVKSPSSIIDNSNIQEKLTMIIKSFNDDKANCTCSTCKFMRKDIKSYDTIESKSSSSQNLCTQKSDISFPGIPPIPTNQIKNKENTSLMSNSVHTDQHNNSAYGIATDRYLQRQAFHLRSNNSTSDLYKNCETKEDTLKQKLPKAKENLVHKYISKMRRSQEELNQLESEYYEIRNKHNSKQREKYKDNNKFNIRSNLKLDGRKSSINNKRCPKPYTNSYNSTK